jgi:hypothetical protein
MKRAMCGLVLLAAVPGLWSCNGDPTDSFREGEKILATPTSVIVDQGSTEFVTVQMVDGQGNQLATDFEVRNPGAGITVVEDTTFLQTTNGSRLPTSERFIVSGLAATTSSFTIAAGSDTISIPVAVVPTGAGIPPVAVTTAGTTSGEPTVLTAPAGFHFFPDSSVAFDAGPGIITDRAADGRSLTVLPFPGSTTATVTIAADYLPAVPLPTTLDIPLAISTTVPAMAGTADPATAPVITIPPPGGSTGFFDGGSYGAPLCGEANTGAPCQLYQFTLAEETTFEANLTWSNTADLGVYFLSADATTDTGEACDAEGNATDPDGPQPEHCEVTLAAGTYLAAIVSYGPFYVPADPNPEWVALEIHTLEP